MTGSMASNSETGEQLLARLAAKPDLTTLETNVFPEGPGTETVTELCGEDGCGKTQFLLHLLANAILPRCWEGVDVGGLETGVLWVDTECQFSMMRLVVVLESRVRNLAGLGEDRVEGLIRDSLRRIHMVRCNSSSNLLMTLYSLESLLSAQASIGLLLLDSMSAFYWIDRCNVAESNALQEADFRKLTGAIGHLVRTYRLAAFITTTALFPKRFKRNQPGQQGMGGEFGGSAAPPSASRESHEYSDYLGRSWQRLVTRRLVLAKNAGSLGTTFSVSVDRPNGEAKLVRQFTLEDHGVQFIL